MNDNQQNTSVESFVRNPWALLLHQGITFIMPLVIGAGAWVIVTTFDHYDKKLDQNTEAIQQLRDVVIGQNAGFTIQLQNHEQRLTRLEDARDGYRRRTP